ncbi:MAG: hypothetical protein FWC83_02165 [Alphaproteobacteria bacterium]|nr:hypothetical protein [Alphaproteobacteria bacterium]
MKKFMFYIIAVLTITLAGAAVFVSGVLFDTSRQLSLNPFIFQPADQSRDRIGRPVELGALESHDPEACFWPAQYQQEVISCYIRDRLIIRFIREYFEVIPSTLDLDRRAASRGPLAAMTIGSATPVFANWTRDMLPELERAVNLRQLRRVHVHPGVVPVGEFFVVRFDMITYNPNDMTGAPHILQNQEIRMRIRYQPGLRDTLGGQAFDARTFLQGGGEPMVIFRFIVDEIVL